jgi:hypothetical protein
MAKYFVLCLVNGCEMESLGPYDTFKERNEVAKAEYAKMDPAKGENVFWADVDDMSDRVQSNLMLVGAFTGEFQDGNEETG